MTPVSGMVVICTHFKMTSQLTNAQNALTKTDSTNRNLHIYITAGSTVALCLYFSYFADSVYIGRMKINRLCC